MYIKPSAEFQEDILGRGCERCMVSATPKGEETLGISTGVVGTLPSFKHGHSYSMVVRDYPNKFSLLFPLRKATTASIVSHLEKYVFLFSEYQEIFCDKGP